MNAGTRRAELEALLEACLDSIASWRAGPRRTDGPTIGITMERDRRPTGDTVLLHGRSGPRGLVAVVRPRNGRWMVVASFPAEAVAGEIAAHLGRDPASVPAPIG